MTSDECKLCRETLKSDIEEIRNENMKKVSYRTFVFTFSGCMLIVLGVLAIMWNDVSKTKESAIRTATIVERAYSRHGEP